ncbi:hypothetical protein EGI26_10620 [Lacihabitans sp. CCS-44]|uniref:sensor histidine kinase n=1 Tax=Lacihabitans sp. CCS-44 TaxID=2487331 RepID=UPI0020CE9D96|nr:histidine kinase [Lacihabitans sp. CCS-44]MCP9755609.1 hypothetical protein [Lacihabitans sp. CCS-44]
MKRILSTILLSFWTVASFAQLKIKQILVDGKVVNMKQKIVLSPTNNDLLFEFEKPNTTASIFYYRLPKLSEKWTQSFYPSAHYQNLSGGKYTFQIFEQSPNHKSRTETLTFEVKEAFWQKSWFWPSIIIYALMVLGIGIYLFSLYDFRQKLKMQYVRNQIASDLHDEVGSNLNSIAIFVELLKKKMPHAPPELMSLLGKITDNSEETVSLMRDTVWAINPDNDSTEKLLEKMESFGIEMLSSKGVAFDFENLLDIKKSHFPMEQRRNIYLIFKEAINNIAKHAEATKVTCRLFSENGNNYIEITDNGHGFDPEETFEGNGLKNFKFRSEDDDIRVIIHSEINKGTKVRIEIFE